MRCQLCEEHFESGLLVCANGSHGVDPTLELRLTESIVDEGRCEEVTKPIDLSHLRRSKATPVLGVLESFMNRKPHALFLAGGAHPRGGAAQGTKQMYRYD